MQLFSRLFTQLDQTNKTNAKIAALVSFFEEAEDEDKLWAIALFSGKRPRRAVNTRLLREWAAEAAGIEPWLFEESYHVVGDLAETIALLLPPPEEKAEKPLHQYLHELIALREKEEEERKVYILTTWASLDSISRFVFNKLLTGGWRLGVSQRLMVRALAKQTGLEANAIYHRLMGDWKPQETNFQELLFSQNPNDNISRPYPFYLAYALEENPENLGKTEDWIAEWKWDGIRSQTIRRKGELFIWSRGEELITAKFPELEVFREAIPDGTVIDGELIAWKDGKPLSFGLLQTRIGRKNVSKKQLIEAPAHIIAYDLLEWEGEDWRKKPFIKRRNQLEKMVQKAGIPDRLSLSEVVDFDDWEPLTELREHARDYVAEGFMLKRTDSVYQTGRKRGDWWKWKVDPLTIDGVMIYAQRGHGRRANLYSDYTFAVWDGDQLVPFAKAYSGLTDKEMAEVDRFVKNNTIERFGPVRSVVPEMVFEIGFEGIRRSSRHKSGVAVRFPRILRMRPDKKAEEADTLERLKAFLR